MKSKTAFRKTWPPPPNRTARTPIVLIVGLLAGVLAGCVTGRDNVEYIPGDRAVVPLSKGDAAPGDGWFVPPAVMQDVIPLLDERFQNLELPEANSNDDRSE